MLQEMPEEVLKIWQRKTSKVPNKQRLAATEHQERNTLIARSAFLEKTMAEPHRLKRQPLQNHIHTCACATTRTNLSGTCVGADFASFL